VRGGIGNVRRESNQKLEKSDRHAVQRNLAPSLRLGEALEDLQREKPQFPVRGAKEERVY